MAGGTKVRPGTGAFSIGKPVVTTVSPATGAAGGDDLITLTGSGYQAGATAKVGANSCTAVTVVSATQITCRTPAGTGTQDVSVTNPNGVVGTKAAAFAYSGGGGFAISGQVTKGGSPLANAGIIELLLSGSVVTTATVDGSGNFSFTGLNNVSYGVRPQPALAYALGASETGAQDPDAYDSVTATNPAATKNFVFADATYFEPFTRYADSAALKDAATGLFTDQGMDTNGGFSDPTAILLDATGGPSGGKAMRYDFDDRTGDCGSYTVRAQGRKTAGSASSTRWIRFRSKLSSNWTNGAAACAGSESFEYKFLNFHIGSGGPIVALLFFGGHTSSPTMVFTFSVTGNGGSTSNAQQGGQFSVGQAGAAFFGAWRTFHIQLVRFDGSSANWEAHLWVNGIKRMTLLGTGAASPFNCPNSWAFVELGANINSGPDASHQRWFSEFAVYSTRPSMREAVDA